MSIVLRPYQKVDIDAIRAEFLRGTSRVCYQAATGSGKTICFVWLAHRIVENGQRVAIIVHRGELIEQTCEVLAAEGLAFGVIAAGYDENPSAPIQVCMIQTLVNRLDRLAGITFLIVDEVHHIMAATYRTTIAAVPKARVLGVTATPERLDGAGLREVFGALIVCSSPSAKLIASGWLAPFVVYAPEHMVDLKRVRTVAGDYALGDLAQRMSTGVVMDDAITEYRKHLDGQSAIAFCTTIDHSRTVARHFRAAGIRARHLDGDTPTAERRALIAALATGEVQVITNCALISEGLDVPSVAGVILLRPTKSLALYLQQIGRGLRPAPGKERAIILDHAGNVFRHGYPDLEHAWSLDGRPKKKKSRTLVRRCPECGAVIPIASRECPECGADLTPVGPAPAARPEPLIQVDPADAHRHWLAYGKSEAVFAWAGTNEARLWEVARARNYKPGWVWHRLKPHRDANDEAVLRTVWG
jgi:superfamily II DNA or RNA helicase